VLTSMGRKVSEDPLFFATAAVSGAFAVSLLRPLKRPVAS
jgi:hypothetical protein